jgi:hypothetical protein
MGCISDKDLSGSQNDSEIHSLDIKCDIHATDLCDGEGVMHLITVRPEFMSK